jgi:hypothetical protein
MQWKAIAMESDCNGKRCSRYRDAMHSPNELP